MAFLPSLDELLEGVPPEKLDAPCKDVHLCEIALSITDWEVIAPFLDISRAEAEEINRDEGKTVQQRIGMLRKWKEKCGRRATYRRLAKRFLKVKRVDLVDEICRVLGGSDSDSDDDSEVIVHKTLLDQYAYNLRHMYPKEFPSFARWPPPPTHTFFNLAMIQRSRVQLGPIDENYIRLTQRGSVDDIMMNKTAIQVKDIFNMYHSSSKQVMVLIEGAPGAGKSTLAWYICDQWGSGILFGEFKLVVFVQLRSPAVQSATSVADLLPRMASGQEREVLSHLETRLGRDVLFVLDGWDEYSGGLSRDSICGKLIISPGSLSMQESTLLITSRPVASGELQQYCSIRIEIVGFAPNKVKEYFKDALKEAHQGEQQAEVLQECLRVRPVIQASCYLPLNAAIVVHLFITEGNTLPTTLHGLFTSLVLNCIVRHLKKTRQEEGKRAPKITSFGTIPAELQPHFIAICAIAFHGIMTNKASFSEEELHSFHLSTESSEPLLSLIQGWSTFKSSWEDLSYSFFHLSVQELLAAFHVSKQPQEKQVEVFKKLFGQPRFAAVLNYYAAFTKLCVQGIRGFIKEVLQSSSGSAAAGMGVRHQGSRSEVQLPRKELHRTILDCLFEAQDPELCQYVATVIEGKLTVDYTMSPFHCMVLGYFLHCLCLTPGGGKLHIDLASTDLDEYKCSYLINQLNECTHGQLSLSLFECEQGGGVSVLIRMLEESCFHCICDFCLTLQMNESTIKGSLLTHNSRIPVVSLTIAALGSSFDSRPEHLLIQAQRKKVGAQHISPVADFIASSGQGTLQELTLSGCVVCKEIAQVLVSCLISRSVLDTLVVSDCTITQDGANILGNSLELQASTAHVKTFHLSEGKPPDNAGTLSVESAHQTESEDSPVRTSHRRVLHLSRCTEVATVLAGFLARNSSLEVIISESIPPENKGLLAVALAVRSQLESWDLSGHTITSAGMKKLSKYVGKNQSLKVLNLSHCNIGLKNTRILAASLCRNRSLKTLNISHCTIPPEGASLLAGLLVRNSNLEVLISGCGPPESARILAVASLPVALAVLSTQESWNLSGYTIPPEGMKMVTDSLADNPTVKTLKLSGCSLPRESALALARTLIRRSNLEVLFSGCTPPESAGVLAVALAIRSTQETWDLSGYTIPLEGMKMLADSLVNNPTLEVLNLSDCSISLIGALILAHSLPRNSNLEVLILQCRPPESAGVLAVFLAVRSAHKSLDLSGHTIPPEGMNILADFLADNPTLEALNLSNCSISPESAPTLARSLAINSDLEVSISGCTPPESAGILAVALAVRSAQESWDLSGHTIPPEGMKMLVDSLGDNPTLEALNISGCSISPEDALTLAHSLARNSNLEVLISGCTCTPPETAGILAVALTVRSTRKSWDLSGHTIPPQGMKMLVEFLTKNALVDTLNLSQCTIPPEGVGALCDFLAKHTSLDTVLFSGCLPLITHALIDLALADRSGTNTCNLSGHIISEGIIEVLANLLNSKVTIDTLNLSGCTIPKEGIRLLAQMLSRNKHVKELNFSRCYQQVPDISDIVRDFWSPRITAVDHLIVSFTHWNMSLKVLDLSWGRLGSQSGKALKSFLRFNQSLQVLILSNIDLSRSALSDELVDPRFWRTDQYLYSTFAYYLAQGLESNTTLRSLSIANCRLTSSTMEAIVEALERRPSLQELDFSHNRLSASEYHALNKRLKQIKVCSVQNVHV